MSECRACLANDVRMHFISNTRYQEIYEKISGTKLIRDNGRLNTICYVCNALLHKFCDFFDMSQKAEQILTKRFLEDVEISQVRVDKMNILNLTMTAIQTTSFVDDGSEEEPEVIVTVKEEPVDHDEWEQFKEEFLDSGDGDTAINTKPLHKYLPKCTTKEPNTPIWPAFQNMEHNLNDIRIKTEAPETNNEENIQNDTHTLDFQNFCKALNIIPVKPDFKYPTEINKGRKTIETSHSCSKCNYTCLHPKTLRRHMKVHDPSNQYSCKLCLYRFKDEKKLACHRKRCTICSICGKKFKNGHGLRIHVRLHTGEKPFSCDYCGRGFNQKTNLQTHLRVHARHKQFPCDICHKTFPFDSFLKRHKLIHAANPLDFESMNQIVNCHKLYTRKKRSESMSKCSVCGKVIQSKGLSTHMRLHSGERPFSCDRCGRGFNQKCNLLVHVERVHTGDEMFTCKVCYNVFPLTSELKRHFLTHNNVKMEINSEFLHELELKVKREWDLLNYTEWNVGLKRDSLNDTERDVELQRDLLTNVNGNIESKRNLSSHTEENLELKSDLQTHTKDNPELTGTKENIDTDFEDSLELSNNEDNLELMNTQENLQSMDTQGNLEFTETEDDVEFTVIEVNPELTDTEENFELNNAQENLQSMNTQGNLEFTETVDDVEFTVIEVNPELTDTEENLELNNAHDNLQSLKTGENPEITDTKKYMETDTEDTEEFTDNERISNLMNTPEKLLSINTQGLDFTENVDSVRSTVYVENQELVNTQENLLSMDTQENLEFTETVDDIELTTNEVNLELTDSEDNQELSDAVEHLELNDRKENEFSDIEENLELAATKRNQDIKHDWSTYTEDYLELERDLLSRTKKGRELKREVLSNTEGTLVKLESTETLWEMELVSNEGNLDFKRDLFSRTADNDAVKREMLSDTEDVLEPTDAEENLELEHDFSTRSDYNLEFKRKLLSLATEEELDSTDPKDNLQFKRELLTDIDDNLQSKRDFLKCTEVIEFKRELISDTEEELELTDTEGNPKLKRDMLTRTDVNLQMKRDLLTHSDKNIELTALGLTNTEVNLGSERGSLTRTEHKLSARDFEMFQQKHIFMVHRKLRAGENEPYPCDMCSTRIFSY